MSLVAWPAPGPPMRRIVEPNVSSSGSARSNAPSSPPTMIASVPFSAPRGPPLTGASSTETPRSRPASASRRATLGSEVLVSTTRLSEDAPASTPRGPSTTLSTSFGVGSEVIVTSAPSAAPAGSSARSAPSEHSASTAGETGSQTITPCPAPISRRDIRAPIRPTPITATRVMRARQSPTPSPDTADDVSP